MRSVLRLLVAAVLLAGLAAPAARADDWTPAGIEHELMCPTCQTRLDLSNAPAAQQIRAALRRAKAEGLTKQQAKRQLVAEYGDAVLAAPPRNGVGWAAWLVPGAVLLGGAAAAVWLARRWRGGRSGLPPAVLAPAGSGERQRLERRVDAELERFE